MSTRTWLTLALVAILGLQFSSAAHAQQPATMPGGIDWPRFMARQDLVYDKLPDRWENGAFTGNGLLGVMVHTTDAGKALVLHVGRSDVMDHDAAGHETVRLPIGDLLIRLKGTITGGSMRLDLWNAEITGHLITDAGTIDFRTFTHATKMVQVIALHPTGGEIDPAVEFLPLPAINPRTTHARQKPSEEETNPPARPMLRSDEKCVDQPLKHGGDYATIYKVAKSGNDLGIYLTVGYFPGDGVVRPADSDTPATVEADNNLNDAILSEQAHPGFLESSHRAWWHSFYPASFLSLPDARMESFYWIQLYKLASATRENRPAIDLMGPWFRDTPWPKIWWNLNIQLTYYPVYTSNHLELGESLCSLIDSGIGQPNLKANAKEFSSDSETIARTSGYDCYGPSGAELCNYPWALHNYFMQYRYSMDDSMLRGWLLPRLKAAMNFYFHNMSKASDGKWHTTRGLSPEYPNQPTPDPDCNIDLALIRWGCQTLIDSCARLKISDPDESKWRDTLANLTPYPTDKNGLMISASQPFAVSHRHYSHMLMVFPLYTMNWDQPENRDLITTSLDHWQSMPAALRGYSYTGASSICSAIGRRDEAVEKLNTFLDGKIRFGCLPNTMYLEAGPVIETPLSAARSVLDLLLQSWGGTLRVFPGVPDSWKDVSFDQLRGEGAFLVSASRRGGKTQWIRIQSLAGEPCRVKCDIADPASDDGVTIHAEADGLLNVDIAKGQTVVLHSRGKAADFSLAPVEHDKAADNAWGLRQ